MNIKKTLFAALVAMVSLTASAQEPEKEYVFQPHWYGQAQIGGQYTLGEVKFGDLVSPNGQLAVGYQFDKIFGARLAVNMWQSKGGSHYTFNGKGKDYIWKYNYVAPTVDLTVDLTNLFGGYNPTRKFSVGVFAGVGANIAFGDKEAKSAADQIYNDATATGDWTAEQIVNDDQYLRYGEEGSRAFFVGNFGANVDYHINKNWSVGVEFNANVLSDKYNYKKAGNTDWYFNALAGVKYAFGDPYLEHDKAPVTNPLEAELNSVKAELAKTKADLTKARTDARKVAPVETKAVKEREALVRDIYFTISSTKIRPDEMVKVMEIVDYMQKYPTSKVSITGYADKGTGNARINMTLSQKRAAIVADVLKKQYHISADRITTDAKGDTVQPKSVEVLNRVAICIAE